MRCWWWACAHEPTITHKRTKLAPFRNVYNLVLLPVLHRRELSSPCISSLSALGSWLRGVAALGSLAPVDLVSLGADRLCISHRLVVARWCQVRTLGKNCCPVKVGQNGSSVSLKASQASTQAIKHSSGSFWINLQRPGPTTTV